MKPKIVTKNFSGLKVLTSGIPLSTPKPQTMINGIDRVLELGLDGIEVEFVHGVRTKESELIKFGRYGKEKSIIFTAHAPYYINLNSKDNEKYVKSKEHIIKTMIAAEKIGAWSVVFHPAFYQGDTSKDVTNKVIKAIDEINNTLESLSFFFNVWLRPETMGKPSQFGSLEEVVEISKHFPNVLPCIDFAHLYARSIGEYNSEKEIFGVFEYIGKELGDIAIKNMHIHISGMEYGSKGEKYHVKFEESNFHYEYVIKAIKYFGVEGVIVSESSNIEYDGIIIKNYYTKLGEDYA